MLNQVTASGLWKPVDDSDPQMMELQWNSVMVPFPDREQCDVLHQPIDYLYQWPST